MMRDLFEDAELTPHDRVPRDAWNQRDAWIAFEARLIAAYHDAHAVPPGVERNDEAICEQMAAEALVDDAAASAKVAPPIGLAWVSWLLRGAIAVLCGCIHNEKTSATVQRLPAMNRRMQEEIASFEAVLDPSNMNRDVLVHRARCALERAMGESE